MTPVTIHPPRAQRDQYPFTGFIDYQGLPIHVENERGSVREGIDADGKPWSITMGHHYGEFHDTEGEDGDAVDVYVGPDAVSQVVVVVRQNDPFTGKYDEDKVMLGFPTVRDAVAAYRAQYNRPGFYGGHKVMPLSDFRKWVRDHANKGDVVGLPSLLDLYRVTVVAPIH